MALAGLSTYFRHSHYVGRAHLAGPRARGAAAESAHREKQTKRSKGGVIFTISKPKTVKSPAEGWSVDERAKMYHSTAPSCRCGITPVTTVC